MLDATTPPMRWRRHDDRDSSDHRRQQRGRARDRAESIELDARRTATARSGQPAMGRRRRTARCSWSPDGRWPCTSRTSCCDDVAARRAATAARAGHGRRPPPCERAPTTSSDRAGALARLDDVAVHMAAWQRTADAAGRAAGGAGVRRRPRRGRARRGQRLPDRRHGGDAGGLPPGQGDDLRAGAIGRGDARHGRRRRRPPDRRHPLRGGDVSRSGSTRSSTQAVAAVDALDTRPARARRDRHRQHHGRRRAGRRRCSAVIPATWVGRGTGVDDAGLARKRAAVAQ